MTPEQYGKDNLRQRIDQMIQLMNLDAPDPILARQVHMIWDAATLAFGRDLYALVGERAVEVARRRNGFCQYCNSEIAIIMTHDPICEHCDARLEARVDELEAES